MEPLHENCRDLTERLFAFALRIVRLCQKLDAKPGVARTLSRQLLAAGTSIGANYEDLVNEAEQITRIFGSIVSRSKMNAGEK